MKKLVPQFKPERVGVQLMIGATTERIARGMRAAGQMRIRVATRQIKPARTLAHFGPIVVIRRGANELRYYEGTTTRPIQEEYYRWWATFGVKMNF